MSKAAQDHANDIGPKGIVGNKFIKFEKLLYIGHDGSNKSTMTSRLEKFLNYFSQNTKIWRLVWINW